MFFGIISFRNFRKGNCKPDNQPGSDGWRGNVQNKSSETVKWICLAEMSTKKTHYRTVHVGSGSGRSEKLTNASQHKQRNNQVKNNSGSSARWLKICFQNWKRFISMRFPFFQGMQETG